MFCEIETTYPCSIAGKKVNVLPIRRVQSNSVDFDSDIIIPQFRDRHFGYDSLAGLGRDDCLVWGHFDVIYSSEITVYGKSWHGRGVGSI